MLPPYLSHFYSSTKSNIKFINSLKKLATYTFMRYTMTFTYQIVENI